MTSTRPVELAHEVRGPAAGPAAVLLHGFPLDRSMWESQADALAKAGRRVVLPDLRGHGRSPAPDEVATMERHAADVVRLMDRLRIDRALLAGFSLGGYVALEAATRWPDRFEALVLADTRAEPDTEDGRRARRATVEAVRRDGVRVLADAMVPKFLTDATRRARPELVERLRATILATSPAGAVQALLGMADRPDQRPRLSAIRVPALVLVGAEDALTPPASAEVLARGIPGARLVTLAGAAHLAPVEAANAFNAALRGWLAALPAAAARAR